MSPTRVGLSWAAACHEGMECERQTGSRLEGRKSWGWKRRHLIPMMAAGENKREEEKQR